MINLDTKLQPYFNAASTGDWYPALSQTVLDKKPAELKAVREFFDERRHDLGFTLGNPHKNLLDIYYSRIVTICNRQLKSLTN